jgi:hypothetical protein
MILLQLRDEGGERYIIGAVKVPVTLEGRMSLDAVYTALLERYGQWREQCPTPQADSEFVKWLDRNTIFESCDVPEVLCLNP